MSSPKSELFGLVFYPDKFISNNTKGYASLKKKSIHLGVVWKMGGGEALLNIVFVSEIKILQITIS